MKPLVAFQFEMQPRAGQTSRECLAAVRGEMTDWLRGLFRGMGVHDLQLSFDGSSVTPGAGHEVQTDERGCATHRLAALAWEFNDPQIPEITWRFSGVVACDARAVEVALVVRAGWQPFALRPLNAPWSNANPLTTVAALRDKLLLGWNCQVEGQPIPTRARLLRKGRVDAFVHDVLLNPKRVLPVVVLCLNGPLKIDIDALHALQVHLGGLAHVAALLDQPAEDRLAKLLGAEVYCWEAVLRIYWPGLLQKELPLTHPYQTWEALQKSLKTAPLPGIVQTLLAPVSAEQYREGRIIRAACAALDGDRSGGARGDPAEAERLAAAEAQLRQAQLGLQRESQAAQRRVAALLDELAELRGQLAALRANPPAAPVAADAEFADLAAELERAWDENARLRTDWEAARRQLGELETDFRNYLDSSALLWESREAADAPAPPAAAGGRSFATVADALRAAADEFADVLVVWEDAERSAEQSLFGSPGKVFQALAAVAEVGRAYFAARDGGPPLGPVDRAFLGLVPFKYPCFESQTTRNLFGAERVFHHRGQSRQMQRHLTLGGGTTNNCLQIYFDFDNAARRVLVGYCGRHLPYARQRT